MNLDNRYRKSSSIKNIILKRYVKTTYFFPYSEGQNEKIEMEVRTDDKEI